MVQISKWILGQDALISTYTWEGEVSSSAFTAIPPWIPPGMWPELHGEVQVVKVLFSQFLWHYKGFNHSPFATKLCSNSLAWLLRSLSTFRWSIMTFQQDNPSLWRVALYIAGCPACMVFLLLWQSDRSTCSPGVGNIPSPNPSFRVWPWFTFPTYIPIIPMGECYALDIVYAICYCKD